MTLLIIGLLIFTLLHLLPAGAGGLRTGMLKALGENAYKGLFALLIIASIVLMVVGWKSTGEVTVYTAPAWGWAPALVFMLGASVCLFAPYMANNISRVLRHPQLCGIVLFGAGHLTAVGNLRSIVLFGGLALWAIIAMLLLNRRDGAWARPDAVARMFDLRLLLAGLVLFLIFLFTHESLFGVAPLPA